jgi:hypothetical protein
MPQGPKVRTIGMWKNTDWVFLNIFFGTVYAFYLVADLKQRLSNDLGTSSFVAY